MSHWYTSVLFIPVQSPRNLNPISYHFSTRYYLNDEEKKEVRKGVGFLSVKSLYT
jgi:hypothetical protein